MKRKKIHDMYERIRKAMWECQCLMWECTHDDNGRLNGSQEGFSTICNLLDLVEDMHSRLSIILSIIKNHTEAFSPVVRNDLITDEDFTECK